jgi:uncharacterized membrane protein YraQ (UPF0718 family)
MTNLGVLVIYGLLIVLGTAALSHGSFQQGLIRGAEQLIKLLPRMLCALVGAGFLAMLVPTEVISSFLGAEAGFMAIVIGTLAGMIIPAGPAISFSIAAVLASEGASVPALVSFTTSWSVFALHRVIIFEIPLLGISFTRLRMLSVLILPLLAGGLTIAATNVLSIF